MGESQKPLEVLLLGQRDVQSLLTMAEALAAVERASRLAAQGGVVMPPKLYLELPQCGGDFRAMPAYVDNSAGLKWVSVYPANRTRSLPTVLATIILCDPETGLPLAFIEGSYITAVRTGAAGGVAAKYLAKKGATMVGMIGAGVQAGTQLEALMGVFPSIRKVKIYDLSPGNGARLASEATAKYGVAAAVVDSVAQAAGADIVVAATPARVPVLLLEHIQPGTHINAIGADAPGKQELDPAILKGAKIVVDDLAQAVHSGEINVPLSKGILKVEEIYGTLGEVVAGTKKSRESEREITVFDSTGLAIYDIVCAKLVYEKAKKGKFPSFRLM